VKATCPECLLRRPVPGAGALFPVHLRPKSGPSPGTGRCPGSGAKVRRAQLVHPCTACAALPEASEDVLIHSVRGVEHRPREPRPLSKRAGPRSPLCETHQVAKERARKAAVRAYDRERKRGVTEEDRQALWVEQGEACGACGRTLHTARKAPPLDHDHRRARELCADRHPENQACRRCARGCPCDECNRYIIGRRTVAQLRMAIEYLENPPAARLGWWDEESADDQS
jgi:hypothetical protein